MIDENGVCYVDNSTLAAVQACECKGALRHVLDYMARDEEAHVLSAGTVAHEVLAKYFKGEDDQARALQRFDLLYRPYSDEYDLGNPDGPYQRLAWPNLHNIMEIWLEDHPLDSFSFSVKPELVEVGFKVPLTDKCVCGHPLSRHVRGGCQWRSRCQCTLYRPAFVFWGRADAVVQAHHDSALYVLDNKTTGRLTPYWAEKFRMDSQMSGYTWGVQQTLGMPVAGVYINAIEFSKLPSDPVRKCAKHGVPYAECGSLHYKSELLLFSRTSDQLEEWRLSAIKLARTYRDLCERVTSPEALIKHTRMTGTFTNACAFCDFKDFCQGGRQTQYIDAMLEKCPWRPF